MARRDEPGRCSYVVIFDESSGAAGMREFADYLCSVTAAGCDTIVVDRSQGETFDAHRRVLRWVARHVAVRSDHLSSSGGVDPIRAAAAVARTGKVIVADPDIRYGPSEIEHMCELLDRHEVVEPQDYVAPLPWWGGIEAGRILVNRAIDAQPDHGATFGFRRSLVTTLPGLGSAAAGDQVRRLATAGAEVYAPSRLFVKREPSRLSEWIAARAPEASEDFDLPVRSAFFFSLLPLLAVLSFFGGLRLAGAFATAVAIGALAFAIRGRFEASRYFPLHAVLFAPLWVLERSVSVWWALFCRLRAGTGEPGITPVSSEQGNGAIAKRSGEAL